MVRRRSNRGLPIRINSNAVRFFWMPLTGSSSIVVRLTGSSSGSTGSIHEAVLRALGPPMPRPDETELVAVRMHDLPVDERLELLYHEVRYLRQVFQVEYPLADLVAHIDAHDRVPHEREEAVAALHAEADRTAALREV